MNGFPTTRHAASWHLDSGVLPFLNSVCSYRVIVVVLIVSVARPFSFAAAAGMFCFRGAPAALGRKCSIVGEAVLVDSSSRFLASGGLW